VSSGYAGLDVGGAGVDVAVGGETGARVRLGATVAEPVGAPNWVNVSDASGGTAGALGAEVETEAQALIAVTSAIEVMRIREGFICINR
jgi:hypothetical protein